jgi:hypothetical protein
MLRFFLFLAVVLSVATAPLVAAAQLQSWTETRPWISARRSGEGIGIRTGNFEWHPGIAAEGGYDSNYLLRSGDNYGAESPIVDVWRLRITPSVAFSTLGARRQPVSEIGGAPKLRFGSQLYFSYNRVMEAGRYEGSLPDKQGLDAGAGARLDALPSEPVGFDLSGDFMRSVEPSNNVEEAFAWNRDSVRLGAGVNWRPLPDVFLWRLGYQLDYYFFEERAFENLDNVQHHIDTRGSFRFLPRTVLIYDARYTFIDYASRTTNKNDGQAIRSRIGVNSLVTARFGVLGLVGWTSSFYQPSGNPIVHNYDSMTGQGEVTYFLQPQPKLRPGDTTVGLSTIAAGVVRDFGNSYLADYFARTRAYAKLAYLLGQSATLDLQAGYTHVNNPSFRANGGRIAGTKQNRVEAQLFAEYRLTETVGINSTLRADTSLNEAVVEVPGGAAGQGFTDNLAFTRFQAWLGVRWFM